MAGGDLFKNEFKYYKAKKPSPVLDNVIDARNYFQQYGEVISRSSLCLEEDARAGALGLIPLTKWEVYEFGNNSGLLYIKNPFMSIGQRFWIRKCLESYPRKPNKRNFDYEMDVDDWWQKCYECGLPRASLIKKLRWTTMGYHHNWNTKVYSEKNKGEFPADLAELCDLVAVALGYNSYKPEAAIVNYYHMDSSLAPHTDHSELTLDAPLFSFSFGQSAIFLIGGATKDVKPTALMLHSGDIIVMSKDSRLCYHAIPRIVSTSEEPWDYRYPFHVEPELCEFKYIENFDIFKETLLEKDKSPLVGLNKYVSKSRININVRQVYSH